MNKYLIVSFPSSELEKPERKEIKGLIMARWLRSYKNGDKKLRKANAGTYYAAFHPFVENLLKKPDSTVRLAVLEDDKDVVLGFSVFREDVLDYVHVQVDARRLGIGKSLIPENITAFSFITELAFKLWQSKKEYKLLQFKPFA